LNSRQKKKRTGWVTPHLTIRVPRKYLIQNCLEPQKFWDDWMDYRDSMRDRYTDRTKIKAKQYYNNGYPAYWMGKSNNRKEINDKIKWLEKRRRLRKEHIKYKSGQ